MQLPIREQSRLLLSYSSCHRADHRRLNSLLRKTSVVLETVRHGVPSGAQNG